MVFDLVVFTRYCLQDALMEAGSFMHWRYFAAEGIGSFILLP
jgi:hypothetical protein